MGDERMSDLMAVGFHFGQAKLSGGCFVRQHECSAHCCAAFLEPGQMVNFVTCILLLFFFFTLESKIVMHRLAF